MTTFLNNYNDYDYLFKVIIVGDSGVGKSCLLNRYTDDQFTNEHYSTIGVDFKIKTIEIGGKQIKLQLWDTAGQERFRTITTSYYRGAHTIVLVFDLTSQQSFENLDKWIAQIEYHTTNENYFLALVGTKSDMVDSPGAVVVKKSVIDEYCAARGLKYYETSAKNGSGIDKLFNELCEGTMKTISGDGSSKKQPSIKTLTEVTTEKKCCTIT